MWVAAINAAAYVRLQERLQASTALYKLHAQRCGALAQQLLKWYDTHTPGLRVVHWPECLHRL